MERYLRVEIKAPQSVSEKIYNTVYRCVSIPILEEDNQIILYFKEFDEKLSNLLSQLFNLEIDSVNIRKFDNKDWDLEWKKSLKPLMIDGKICIYQSWQKKHIPGQKKIIYIQIDPKMSFGTGYNETTQLMLKMILKFIDKRAKFVLDFGCGTGILAIAAAKLYGCRSIAIDNDLNAVKDAMENVIINKVKKLVSLKHGTLLNIPENNFDAVFANIDTGVLTDNLQLMREKLKSNGKLIVSGILKSEKKIFTQSLRKFKFEIINIIDKSEWTGIYARKS